MPKYDYDPEVYDDDDPTFEPNRARRKQRYQKERERENLEEPEE